jgi:hypothetical protein
MCNPLAVMGVMAVMSAATTTAQVVQANHQADATEAAANNAAAADYTQENAAESQINQQNEQDSLQRAQQAMQERAKLRVSAGDAGIGGISPTRDLVDSFMRESNDQGIIATNNANHIASIEAQKNATYAQDQGRYNVASAGAPGLWTAGLQIGASTAQGAFQGYSMGNQIFK